MYNMEKTTYKVLEAIIKEFIQEFNKNIVKERMSTQELRISKVCTKKELEMLESHLKSLEKQLKESYAKVENGKKEKEKLED